MSRPGENARSRAFTSPSPLDADDMAELLRKGRVFSRVPRPFSKPWHDDFASTRFAAPALPDPNHVDEIGGPAA